MQFIKNSCPSSFDAFKFIPSIGNSGGTIIIWKSSRFVGQVEFQNEFAMMVEFTSTLSGATWMLTNVYAPLDQAGKELFLAWLSDIVMPDDTD
jgi:hypothetical protein